MMVIRKTYAPDGETAKWEVGHYIPTIVHDQRWHPIVRFDELYLAAQWLAYLNGGYYASTPRDPLGSANS